MTTISNIQFDSLSVEQKYAYLQFKQGKNLFITGPGGTGKTRWIQFVAQHMDEIGRTFQVCALTGCAAVLLNCKAKTVHSWSGIKLGKGPNDLIVSRIMRNPSKVKDWRSVSTLIIDEVSMMSAKMLDLLDDIGKHTRRNTRPFGGIQVILTGDFFQLPPVGDFNDPSTRAFCFESPRWPAIFPIASCIELRTMFRQSDPEYVQILGEVRRGELTKEHAAVLRGRVRCGYDPAEYGGIVPTKIFPIRAKVDYTNNTMYAGLDEDEIAYIAQVEPNMRTYIDTGLAIPTSILEYASRLTPAEIEYEVAQLLGGMQVGESVNLKLGTIVMCTANIDVDNGICNGSQGIVVDFVDSNCKSEMPLVFANSASVEDKVPLVRFANGRVRRMDYFCRQSDDCPTIVAAQIPLRLAWAMTIHKMQGATMDMAEMDIGNTVFEFGQTYVALSRVKALSGLYLTEFYPHKIKANPDVIAFYGHISTPADAKILELLAAELVLDPREAAEPGYPRLTNPHMMQQLQSPAPSTAARAKKTAGSRQSAGGRMFIPPMAAASASARNPFSSFGFIPPVCVRKVEADPDPEM